MQDKAKKKLDSPSVGQVALVGAGPGALGLLTLRGKELLEAAQTVVYDRLVGPDILALIPPNAERINVGKESGRHPVPQERISQLLAEKALEGKRVVRLKGGDCFLFGRGGEELEVLIQQGIPFEVAPGIPSPIGATAYAGIPVTHRDYCASVHLITGHRKKDGALSLDYGALARLSGTLVFLMSLATAGEIAAGLMEAGMDGEMPAAVIEKGTRPEQRKLVTTLERLEEDLQREKIGSPALILVGKVCALSEQFDWFSSLPLKGKRILVTRPKTGAERLAGSLRALGANVLSFPAIETRPIPFSVPVLSGFTHMVFTSATGVQAFFQGLRKEGKDARSFYGLRILAVGKETASALERYGISPDFLPQVHTGQALAQEALEKGEITALSRPLWPCAKTPSPDLERTWEQAGISLTSLAVYETVFPPFSSIAPDEVDLITFTSQSCVESFAAGVKKPEAFSHLPAVCIGPKTAQAAEQYFSHIAIAPAANMAAMVNTIKEMW